MRPRISRRPMRFTRRRLSAASPTAPSISPSRWRRAEASKRTCRAPSAAATGLGERVGASDLRSGRIRRTRLRRQEVGRARTLRARRELRLSKGYHTAAAVLDEGRGVAKNPAAAADELLRAVAADAGESIADLTRKTQTWTVDTIKAVEMRLSAAGYYSGPIDGKSGPALAPALKQWRLLGPPEKS